MRAREHIKLFIGEYNALCDDSKYHVLERIMKKIIFEGKKLRDSLLKEILTIEKLERMRFQYCRWIFHTRKKTDPLYDESREKM